MAPKKLVCDRCGKELSDRDAIELALEGTAAWHAFVLAKGEEPRGIFPCENYIRCGGQMIDWKDKDNPQGGKTNEL